MSGALVAFFAACLSGIGVGSGSFYLLYLTGAAGLTQYAAQGVNLIFFCVATLAASLLSLRRHSLSIPRLLSVLMLGIPGAALGAAATLWVPADIARRVLACLMLCGGVLTLRSALHLRIGKREKKRLGRDESLDK